MLKPLWSHFTLFFKNTYFVPDTILGIQRDRQNRQSLCSRGIYMLVKKIDNTKKKMKYMSANDKYHGGEKYFVEGS